MGQTNRSHISKLDFQAQISVTAEIPSCLGSQQGSSGPSGPGSVPSLVFSSAFGYVCNSTASFSFC